MGANTHPLGPLAQRGVYARNEGGVCDPTLLLTANLFPLLCCGC